MNTNDVKKSQSTPKIKRKTGSDIYLTNKPNHGNTVKLKGNKKQ